MAAVTTPAGSQPDRVRVVLVVAKISDNDQLKTNINSRYLVDSVDVTGNYKARISDGLNKDLQSMVGKNLDIKRADELRDRILKDFRRRARRGLHHSKTETKRLEIGLE